MRLYIPTTLPDLAVATGLRVPSAHAVTEALAAALPEEDLEGLELAALLMAADASVEEIARRGAPPRRVVAVAEVPGQVRPIDPDASPSRVAAPATIPWSAVESLHVDDDDAGADVAAAAAGDDEALDRAADRDLLWYDVTERETLVPD